jgi:hypothetical protein
MARQGEPGIGEVVRLVGCTVVAALAAMRLYAFLHDFGDSVHDPMAWLTSAVALVLLVGAIWLLARTLGEA